VSHVDLPLSVLWHNRQIKACFGLGPKPKNHRGEFEAQITKPELSVLRPKPGNPPPPWFTIATSFKAKLEKTIAVGFEAKPLETVTAGFKAKPLETVATDFEAKPAKTVRVVLRPNHSPTVVIGFEAQTDEKPSEWF
jgi:hypothetical protein